MATEILKSFNHLQSELEEARSSLKGVDENIKRLIGRDPSELPPRPGVKRPLNDKILHSTSKLPRREKVYEEPIKTQPKGLISKVIAAPKEIPSRQDALDKQGQDEKFKARNRRMFGALLGTLQKFQQEEAKLKKKEEKRSQIEKKIEEHEMQEKEEIKKERQELFLNRRKKQQEIKMIELKMLRMKEYTLWENSQKPRAHFIVTKAKPPIHYLPRRMSDKSKELLSKSKKDIEEQIEKKRQAIFDELTHIEERMKKNFEGKNQNQGPKEETSNTRHDRHNSDNDSDDDTDSKVDEKEQKDEPMDNIDDMKMKESEENQDNLDISVSAKPDSDDNRDQEMSDKIVDDNVQNNVSETIEVNREQTEKMEAIDNEPNMCIEQKTNSELEEKSEENTPQTTDIDKSENTSI
ncbi:hypothetical protein GWI33_008247 [Rhynchophorus ferrugineus]|uniref:Pinin/SDK/MemA protein domain-containing protein n=1 Tax=Rhynchophorus ferrugineus TaxID=354439 RepID=A0A834IIL4_RHYFE|nr:hypothetical protein GWI33_008247 [Rhynchophorus ferrugineus]